MIRENNIAKNLDNIISHLPHKSEIKLIAVSKKQPPSKLQIAINACQKEFGENIVQEALEKWPELKQKNPYLKLHYLGKIQSNKLKEIIDFFDVIHSLDRIKIAEKIHQIAPKKPVFIQINIGEEAQKNGVSLSELGEFILHCKEKLDLNIQGLMCVPPKDEIIAPYFALMQKLTHRYGFKKISMGMSNDYETAIKFGATHIRIGTKIFG